MMMFEDGTYRLTRCVSNPEHNARKAKNDWRYSEGWEKGTTFYLRTVGPVDDRWQEIQLDGVSPVATSCWDIFALLVARSERLTPELPSQYLKRTENTRHALDILDYLANTTGLSCEMIEAAIKDINGYCPPIED